MTVHNLVGVRHPNEPLWFNSADTDTNARARLQWLDSQQTGGSRNRTQATLLKTLPTESGRMLSWFWV